MITDEKNIGHEYEDAEDSPSGKRGWRCTACGHYSNAPVKAQFAPCPVRDKQVIGFVLTREGLAPWMFLGTTPEDVATAIKNEIDGDEGMSPDEFSAMTIEKRYFRQHELDTMPEFPGW